MSMKKSTIANQVCTYCVMDTTVPDIVFDKNGQCNLCLEHIHKIDNEASQYDEESLKKLKERIQKSSKSKKYDCIPFRHQ